MAFRVGNRVNYVMHTVPAEVVAVHANDYTIRNNQGQERQTVARKMLPTQIAPAHQSPKKRSPKRSPPTRTSPRRPSSDRTSPKRSPPKGNSPKRSPVKEKNKVKYRNSGGKLHNAVVVKVHYDDRMIPYYSIRLPSGERETIGNRLFKQH